MFTQCQICIPAQFYLEEGSSSSLQNVSTLTYKIHGVTSDKKKWIFKVTAEFISWSLQPQGQVKLANLGWRHKSGECAKPCARRSECFCSQSGVGDWSKKTVRFVRFALKVTMQNDGDFVEVILLYRLGNGKSHTR
jgi:hypothetical protein